MKIWLINHYAVPPQYYPLARPSLFAKSLIKMGHEVTIIAASTVHNSDCQNLIEDGLRVKHFKDDGISYVLINCKSYKGNGKDRVINILQFACRLPKVLDILDKPDVIVATSFDPLTCYAGIRYAKKHGIKAIAEIADLWPETLVAYNGISPMNPAVLYLRYIEKKIYTMADNIVFTMEGAYDYIKDQGWEKVIPRDKVAYINNGIDLELFNYNKDHFQIQDDDLDDTTSIKIVYTGSIRKANQVDFLIDVAKKLRNSKVRVLIWGAGDEESVLREYVKTQKIDNVIFKGRVEKRYVPYIVSKADYNFLDGKDSQLLRYGLSANKMFDYFAAGKPVLTLVNNKYNPLINKRVGIPISNDVMKAAEEIDSLIPVDENNYISMCRNAREAAKEFDFKNLTNKLAALL